MRFGTWRGIAPRAALALTTALAIGVIVAAMAPRRAGAGIICHTIPRVVDAVDVNTGGPYNAPPIPNGCYAKDPLGEVAKLLGLLHGCCSGCHGLGCNLCGGTGKCGHCASCCGTDPGCGGGHPCGDPGGACGGLGNGCGLFGWRCLLNGHNGGNDCGGGGLCSALRSGGCGSSGHASTVCTSLQSAPAPIVSGQCALGSPQSICSKPGCLLRARHFHRMGKGCSACNGQGCGLCRGGGMSAGTVCGACGGAGCGACGGLGLFHHPVGDPCTACGGRGCKLCGGTGCCTGLCSRLCGVPLGLVGKAFHIGEIEWFVGPGGPVPLTPGYVPYVVTTRSPRDYFAFPPHSDLDP
jgi:hypothetical protein